MFKFSTHLVLVVLLVALGSVSQAVTMNPETFETYALTNDFQDVPNTGWFNFNTTNATNEYAIVTGQYLDLTNTPNLGKAETRWGASLDKTTVPVQTLSFDIYMDTIMTRCFIRYTNESSTGGNYYDNPGFLNIGEYNRIDMRPNGGTDHTLPGGSISVNTWYTVEQQFDFSDGTTLMRARYGVQGGTMNEWTDWYEATISGNYTGAQPYSVAVSSQSSTLTSSSHTVLFDNFSIVPEPTTMAVLVAGGLLSFLRKRRRA